MPCILHDFEGQGGASGPSPTPPCAGPPLLTPALIWVPAGQEVFEGGWPPAPRHGGQADASRIGQGARGGEGGVTPGGRCAAGGGLGPGPQGVCVVVGGGGRRVMMGDGGPLGQGV